MRFLRVVLCSSALFALPIGTDASAETYQEYLSRLRDICSVDCMQPREFQRAARKRNASDEADMAVIMDIAQVRRRGSKFELLNLNFEVSPLEELAVLGSAGVNTSSRNGIGGLPRGSGGGISPNVVIIEIDEDTLFDILNVASPIEERPAILGEGNGIVVEGDSEREFTWPSLAALRSYFRNRRVVVRGTPKLEAVFIGARRDFRRKQVTLKLGDADNLVMLPRYDSNGCPVLAERQSKRKEKCE